MKRRDFFKTVGLGTAGLALSQVQFCQRTLRQKPNIIFILADDLGYGELGCYGQNIIRTPNIDTLAAEGMRFTQFYSGSPVCAPSRCVLLTGKHTGHAYIRDNGNPEGRVLDPDRGQFPGQHPIPDSEVTLAELLHDQGYATGAMGKWGLGQIDTSGDPNHQGFDLFYGYNCQVHAHNHYPRFLLRNHHKEMLPGNDRTLTGGQYSQDLFIKEAKRFIRENKDRSFFLYLPFIIPHLSIQVPDETLSIYKGIISESDYVHRGYLKHPYPRAGYAAMVTHMDKGIGQIMALLKELELDRNTIVFFSSDNGPTYNRLGGSDSEFFRSAGPFRGLKGSLYEGGIRVPLIARYPGHIQAGSVNHHVAAFWDILPTICDLSQIDPPSSIDGISLASTLLGQPQKQHEFFYWEFPDYGGQQAVRLGNWKAIRTGLKEEEADTRIQLYDLETDPSEAKNVADRYPEIVSRCRNIVKIDRVESRLFPFPEILAKEMSSIRTYIHKTAKTMSGI
jgi:arylsulfatase A